jgi:hypothetical protein
MNEWIAAAMRVAEEVDQAIEEHGTDIDVWWVQDRVRSIAWHLRGSAGNPGPVNPVARPD